MVDIPKICGYYSITADGDFEESASSLRYFIPPKLPINLNKGIENIKAKSYQDEEMGHILRFLVNHKHALLNKTDSLQGDCDFVPIRFITYRSILKTIICSKVLNRSWTVFATKYRGNIYLSEYKRAGKTGSQTYSDAPWKKALKVFKNRCLSDHPNQKPNMSQVYDAGRKFFCVFKRKLCNRQLLFAAQMDGTDSDRPLNLLEELKPNQFIALKMYYELNSWNKRSKFEKEMIHILWAFCDLVGIERVHVGFRDNFGVLKKIKCQPISEVEEISKRNWRDSMDGFEYLNQVIGEIENDLKDVDCPYTTIRYHYDPETKSVSSAKHEGKTEYSFLSEWYLKEINNEPE